MAALVENFYLTSCQEAERSMIATLTTSFRSYRTIYRKNWRSAVIGAICVCAKAKTTNQKGVVYQALNWRSKSIARLGQRVLRLRLCNSGRAFALHTLRFSVQFSQAPAVAVAGSRTPAPRAPTASRRASRATRRAASAASASSPRRREYPATQPHPVTDSR